MGRSMDIANEVVADMRVLSARYGMKKDYIRALGNASGVSESMITKITSGDREPSARILDKLEIGIRALRGTL